MNSELRDVLCVIGILMMLVAISSSDIFIWIITFGILLVATLGRVDEDL